jgi:hypothetical protein
MIPLLYVTAEELLWPSPGLAFPGGRPFVFFEGAEGLNLFLV